MSRDNDNRSQPAASKKPTLFIEVKLNESTTRCHFIRTDEIRREVIKWLTSNFKQLKVGQHLDIRTLSCGHLIRCLKIADYSAPGGEHKFHILEDHELDIAVYSLVSGPEDETPPSSQAQEDEHVQFTVTRLPHVSMDGLWESLVYAEPIPETILRIITRMLRICKEPTLNPSIIHWHNLILLHGPPGSGKTTLAHALAQKLSIRLAQSFIATNLVEVNSHTLLSKWFGESSKLVGKLFDTISCISSDETLLTVVIIDEVETLASSREKASRANECSDAIRSTNEFLQGLDRMRKRPNVVFICTSNLQDNTDEAFMDRCGIKRFIDSPNVECAYEIFRSVVNELIKSGFVTFQPPDTVNMQSSEGYTMPEASPPGLDPSLGLGRVVYIPNLEWINVHPFQYPNSPPRQLLWIARAAKGLSGRTLRRLPMLAMAEFTTEEPCKLGELLTGLARAVTEEKRARPGDGSGSDEDEDMRADEDTVGGVIGMSEGGIGDTDNWSDFSLDGFLTKELLEGLPRFQHEATTSSSLMT